MSSPPSDPVPALSFGAVADAYASARPTYPAEAAAWLAGSGGSAGAGLRLLELGAGTGRLTEQLAALGHRVLATDPLAPMLAHLLGRLPGVLATIAAAEHIPARSRSFDAVLSGQAFHWFDTARALPEIARVLRPGGHLALVWNLRDERIPWVRRLGELIGPDNGTEQSNQPTETLLASGLFGFVETATFRHWQPLDAKLLRDLVTSRSNVAVLGEAQRRQVLAKVDALYAEYGRGPDGMLLPYVTHCYKTVVKPQVPTSESAGPGPPEPPEDTDPVLIDLR